MKSSSHKRELTQEERIDLKHLNAAIGWIQLGNITEAEAELARLSPKMQSDPQVLQRRWELNAKFKRWEACIEIAEELIKNCPGFPHGWSNKAYSLSKLRRYQEAYDLLFPLAERFLQHKTIPYDLACYACRLGKLEQAKEWLGLLLEGDDLLKWKKDALADRDLEPLWTFIQEF